MCTGGGWMPAWTAALPSQGSPGPSDPTSTGALMILAPCVVAERAWHIHCSTGLCAEVRSPRLSWSWVHRRSPKSLSTAFGMLRCQ
jgi:hypothetical protein